MQSSGIEWTAEEYSLKEFLRTFPTSLPKIVKVTEGFLGRQEVDTLSASTVLRIHCLFLQRRAIVECKNGSILSIPVNLESMVFNVVDQKHKTGPFTMKEVLLHFNLPVTITSTKDLTFREMYNPRSKDQELKQMTVKQTYDQEYLLGHSMLESGKLLIRSPVVIPMYMKEIKLVIAEGIKSGDETEWNRLCDSYDKMVKDIGNLDHFIFTDITLLDKDKLDHYTGEYAEIEPIYIDLNKMDLEQEYQEIQARRSLPEIPNDNLVQSQGEQKPKLPPKPNIEMGFSRYVAAPTSRIKPLFTVSRSSNYIQTQKAKRIISMSEVPSDLRHLSVDEVCDCLQLLNLGKYIETFQSEQIDGHLLSDLNRDIMQNTFGMNYFHVIKMIRFRDGWRPK
ncbi:uncharacterized protein [Scyliorhinus torazame]|uniref:uncharacterized protein n=1 Tax=Scyliorhinus torazame TaxID=75743 RepID=UPI003B5B91ED